MEGQIWRWTNEAALVGREGVVGRIVGGVDDAGDVSGGRRAPSISGAGLALPIYM